VLICDHASNWVPPALQDLGLPREELLRHIAWDPGALEVGRRLAALLDAPLVHAGISRLVLDVNRDPSHPGSIVTSSEDTGIPGNREITPMERARRVRDIYEPYHAALAEVIERAPEHGGPQLVAIHSFTPVFRREQRPWHVGVLAADDRRMADRVLACLRADRELVVGDNQPYAPTDGVYHTLARHCTGRQLHSVMLEVRADLVGTPAAQSQWANRLAAALRTIH
jgi:predicted N-formylglutamate amidohydrolase